MCHCVTVKLWLLWLVLQCVCLCVWWLFLLYICGLLSGLCWSQGDFLMKWSWTTQQHNMNGADVNVGLVKHWRDEKWKCWNISNDVISEFSFFLSSRERYTHDRLPSVWLWSEAVLPAVDRKWRGAASRWQHIIISTAPISSRHITSSTITHVFSLKSQKKKTADHQLRHSLTTTWELYLQLWFPPVFQQLVLVPAKDSLSDFIITEWTSSYVETNPTCSQWGVDALEALNTSSFTKLFNVWYQSQVCLWRSSEAIIIIITSLPSAEYLQWSSFSL